MNQEQLCNLLYDLHLTTIEELKAKAEGQDIDPIKLVTATLHMLYLANLNESFAPVLYHGIWSQDEERFFQVMNALMYLGSMQTYNAMSLEDPDKWRITTNLALSELLFIILGKPRDYKEFLTCIAAAVKLLGFKPMSGNKVLYACTNLSHRDNNTAGIAYVYRAH